MAEKDWPEWFSRRHPEMPERDDAGHELGPGLVSSSYVPCKPCPASIDGRGHHITFCGVIGCDAAEIRPIGCSGAYGPTRDILHQQAIRDRGPGGHLGPDGMPRR
jgi:hypothetical protein